MEFLFGMVIDICIGELKVVRQFMEYIKLFVKMKLSFIILPLTNIL